MKKLIIKTMWAVVALIGVLMVYISLEIPGVQPVLSFGGGFIAGTALFWGILYPILKNF